MYNGDLMKPMPPDKTGARDILGIIQDDELYTELVSEQGPLNSVILRTLLVGVVSQGFTNVQDMLINAGYNLEMPEIEAIYNKMNMAYIKNDGSNNPDWYRELLVDDMDNDDM